MANKNNTTSSYNRRSNYKKRTYENNQHQETRQDNKDYEFNAYRSYRLNSLSYYGMMNVFDLYKPEQIRDVEFVDYPRVIHYTVSEAPVLKIQRN